MTWLPKPPKEPKVKGPLTNGTILDRIRLTYPILRASRVDSALRQLILSELLSQVYKEGGSVVIPTGVRLQPVGEKQFAEYKAQLAGITQENAGEITARLIELGMHPNAG
jgi:hypothetical protein